MQVAERCGVHNSAVKNVIIWGNHSSTQYPDVNHGTVNGKPIRGEVKDDAWLDGEFITSVQQRGAAIIKVWEVWEVSGGGVREDDACLDGKFIVSVQQRVAAIIKVWEMWRCGWVEGVQGSCMAGRQVHHVRAAARCSHYQGVGGVEFGRAKRSTATLKTVAPLFCFPALISHPTHALHAPSPKARGLSSALSTQSFLLDALTLSPLAACTIP